jgi:HEAT repeat protein
MLCRTGKIAAGISEVEMQASKKGARSAVPEDEGSGSSVNQLIADLHTHDWKQRERARWQLAMLRERAVKPLIDALEDPDWHVRWEAAKALEEIADARAAPALVRALRDRRFGVRWLASDALIALREAGVPSLLKALAEDGDSIFLRNGTHHVLRDLTRGHVRREVAEILEPVIRALESIEPSVTAPVAAQRALGELPKRVLRKSLA